jgi:hypothetical protein
MWVALLLSVIYTGWIFWQRNKCCANADALPRRLAAYGTRV